MIENAKMEVDSQVSQEMEEFLEGIEVEQMLLTIEGTGIELWECQ